MISTPAPWWRAYPDRPDQALVAEAVQQFDRSGQVPVVLAASCWRAGGRANGRPVGRRTLARELGVSEHEARQLLARATNGSHPV